MSYYPLIAASGGDILPLVIIIVVVLAQVIKAAKGAKPAIIQPGRETPDGGGTQAEPADELKKFLESLTGGVAHPHTERQLPLPPVPRQQPRQIKVIEPVRVPVIEPARVEEDVFDIPTPDQPVAVTVVPPPLPAKPVQVTWQDARHGKPDPATLPDETQYLKLQVVNELFERQSVRKAIILREILGPCFALRRS
jgi:hypothetical protein